MRPRFRPAVLFWIAALLLLGLALRQTDFAGVLKVLGSLEAAQIAVLVLVNILVFGLITLRWGLALKEFGRPVPFFRLLGYRLAGFGLSYFTPGPQIGGEPLQILLLRRKENIPGGPALASVFFDRLMEMLANFIFLAFGLTMLSFHDLQGKPFGRWGWIPAVFAAFLAVGIPIAYLAFLWRGGRPLSLLSAAQTKKARPAWVVKLAKYTTEAEEQIGLFLEKRPSALTGILLVSTSVWAVSVAEFYLLLSFLGLSVDLAQVVLILTAARVAFLLPLPGALGALEAGLVLAAGWAGFNPAYGVAASLLIRLRDVTFGGIGLWMGSGVFGRRAVS